MTEAELLSQFRYASSALWDVVQWLVSISFAVMIAAYLGSKRLTLPLISIIIIMYTFTWYFAGESLGRYVDIMDASVQELRFLLESGQLSLIGIAILERSEAGSLGGIFYFLTLFFTYGFIIYCYINVKNSGQKQTLK